MTERPPSSPVTALASFPCNTCRRRQACKCSMGLAPSPIRSRADPLRNVIIIQGSGAERRSIIDAVLSFDADWMRGQSVGIFPLKNSAPEPVTAGNRK